MINEIKNNAALIIAVALLSTSVFAGPGPQDQPRNAKPAAIKPAPAVAERTVTKQTNTCPKCLVTTAIVAPETHKL